MKQPAQGRISQGFHAAHQAVDIVNAFRSPIVAPITGTVTAVGQMGSGTSDAGLVVQIGVTATEMHRLCHLDSYIVKVGQVVQQGQLVGYMGYTGYTIPSGIGGTHLHWVMWRNGVRVDGRKYVTNTGGQIMDTDAKVKAQYYTLRGSEGTASERRGWIGRSYEEFNATARPEVQGRTANITNLTNAVKTLTNERNQARTQVATLTKEVLAERDKVKVLHGQVNTLQAEIDGAKEAYKQLEAQHQAKIDELNKVIVIKDTEIARLNKELQSCESASGDCADKTGIELIIVGIKKLFERSK